MPCHGYDDNDTTTMTPHGADDNDDTHAALMHYDSDNTHVADLGHHDSRWVRITSSNFPLNDPFCSVRVSHFPPHDQDV
jgi:hypothetical protein